MMRLLTSGSTPTAATPLQLLLFLLLLLWFHYYCSSTTTATSSKSIALYSYKEIYLFVRFI